MEEEEDDKGGVCRKDGLDCQYEAVTERRFLGTSVMVTFGMVTFVHIRNISTVTDLILII